MALSEYEVRKGKAETLRSLGINPYAQSYDKKQMISDLLAKEGEKFRDVEEIVPQPKNEYKTAGRLTLFRSHGKLSFGKLLDESGEIQIMFHKDNCRIDGIDADTLEGKDLSAYKIIEKLVDVGDFLGVEGELFLTHKGELTLFVQNYTFLAKAIRPLGDKFHGIGDDQERAYRQRYLDMIFNRDTMERMKFRSNFIRALREFYRSHDFIEIDCPILTPAASGAAAKPFITHHNDFDTDFYLRICNETELKKATVGGLEKVFTIATDFRNEGSDPSHLQEFMMLEHQSVYRSYHEDMHFTEQMFEHIFRTLKLNHKIMVKDKLGNAKEVNFQTPRPKIDYVEGVNKASGLDISTYGIDDADKLRADIRKKGHEFEGMDEMGTMTLIDYLYKKVLRPSIVGPVFVYNYPRIIAPLARISDEDPNKCEKWQVVVNGREIINSYGELVDPVKQQTNFEEQAKAEAGGDAEATSADANYVLAMEYGMPIQAGFGMGIDRIIALITAQDNLKDVVMFPLMKPLTPDNKELTDKKDSLKVATAIVNGGAGLEPWKIANTIAHLTAGFGARMGKGLISNDHILTHDGKALPLNIQHAIVIKQAENNKALLALYEKATAEGMHAVVFTKEMLETTNDNKIKELTAEQNLDTITLYGVLVYGKKNEVDTLTKEYKLFSGFGDTAAPQEPKAKKASSGNEKMPAVKDAQALADKYLTDTRRHCEQVGKVMQYFARKLHQNEELRYITGLLHDVDRDHIGKNGETHLHDEFHKIAQEINLPQAMIDDIRSHGHETTGVPVDLLIRKYLISVDELSGFLYAYSLMRPEGFDGMDAKGVLKRMKDKKFAAGVNRDHVRYCETFLNIPLEEFIPQVIEALTA